MNKIIIIGAGPAGLSAAITIAQNGEEVLVLDEYMLAGGRLLGQLYEEPTGNWWNGITESENLYEKAIQLGVDIQLNTSVYDMEKQNNQWIIYTDNGTYFTKNVLLATGAAEQPFAIPGWTLPGVMSVGAAQVMTNVHRVKPGKRGIIVGVNVLSSAIAMELQLAGIHVKCITLPKKTKLAKESGDPLEVMNSLLHVSHMAPSKFVQLGSKLMKNDLMKKMGISFYPKNGIKMWDIPIMLRKAVIEIYGDKVVEGVKIATITPDGEVVKGTEENISADFVCITGGLYPLAELAAIAGCPFYHIEELGGHVPLHNEKMETTIEGLYVAGNITGIEGAKVAMSQGVVAGFSILNHIQDGKFNNDIEKSIKEIEQTRNSAYIQFHPNVEEGKHKLKKHWENYIGKELCKMVK
ncbi:NAD(P)/FAD-dependent oxidoreductase [Pseudogracilibacillus auburnensis]|uniref:Thioredoxin reductase n=1 Tax=Pseudogracilibacillus auburnensis TaxID=1494959 RepID=A0A2V3VVC7_9BACI|nr:NAD(P)/FAD-dependent oxidoreductase [Pseudogracilibacillus auburnensis]PXW80459.1 thioredoxin reductase [Pseudogracilibacillus auburnensis]